MNLQHGETRVVRKSLPLTQHDLLDLETVRRTPAMSGFTSEAGALQELVRRGMAAVIAEQNEAGYAALAAQRAGSAAARKATTRRRRPSWADEP